ncbi:MAG: SDR family oxidoreductase [Bryobacterales bacterium]|nr:SDR family oxidoreductase [Bryobacterales bacterium]
MTVWELFKLDGKVAVVTGAARNLGYDMALALAEAGADLVITSRRLAEARAAADRIRGATGRGVLPVEMEVTVETQVEQMVETALAEYGRIDILVNNAGNVAKSTPETAPFERRALEAWSEVVAVNLTGVFLCSKHVVARAMKPARSGNIINIASTAGVVGKDRRQYWDTGMGGATLDYHAAKGGVISMTRDMAAYLAPDGIRANCISPGGFWRNQPPQFVERYNANVPMGRMGQDGKELKGAVVFLASEASSYVTGHNLVVDGGLTAW